MKINSFSNDTSVPFNPTRAPSMTSLTLFNGQICPCYRLDGPVDSVESSYYSYYSGTVDYTEAPVEPTDSIETTVPVTEPPETTTEGARSCS